MTGTSACSVVPTSRKASETWGTQGYLQMREILRAV